MCLRFQFCTHQRVCILYFLIKSQIRCTLMSNQSFGPCLPCVIQITTVFCVHSVLEHLQQQLGSWSFQKLTAEQLQIRASGSVRQGRRHGPSITTQISPGGVTLLQPARRASMLGHLSSLRPHQKYYITSTWRRRIILKQ